MPDSLVTLLITAIVMIALFITLRPERGLYWRWQRAQALAGRVLQEDALKHIHQCELHGDR